MVQTKVMKKYCLWVLTLAFVVGSLLSCGGHSKGATDSLDGANWADSAYQRVKKAEYYYNNNLRDSLFRQLELDMEFDRKHEQWTWYYYSWMMLVNKTTFSGNVMKALDEAKKMHRDAIERNNDYGKALSNYVMGLVYAYLENNIEAAPCFEQALKLYPDDAEQSVKFSILSYYVTIQETLKNYDKIGGVLSQWKQLIDTKGYTKSGNPETRAHWYYQYYKACFNYNFAKKALDQASDNLDSIQYYMELSGGHVFARAYQTGARVSMYMALGDYSKALEMNNSEYRLNKELDAGLYLQALRRRSEIFQALGQDKEALDLHIRYATLKDSMTQTETRGQMSSLYKFFEVEELKAENARMEREREQEKMHYTFLLFFVVVLGFVIIIYFSHRSEKNLEREHKKLLEAYDQLAEANARAEESSKMKTAFIQQMSHEVRTPLNILCGFTQVLTNMGAKMNDDERRDVAQHITDSTNRLSNLVGKMLELSDAGSMTVIERNDDVKVEQIMFEAIELSGIMDNKHVKFQSSIPEGVGATMMHTNMSKAARVIELLLDNAQKFLTKPTEMQNEKQTPGNVWLKVDKTEDGKIRFAIEDSGIGVPAGEAERIFDDFVQLNEYYDGVGIGLTVARSIARRMGGDVVLDTTYEHGARFCFTLPVA